MNRKTAVRRVGRRAAACQANSYNANNPFAVVAGTAGGAKAGKTSYVLCHQPKSFDWRARQASPHPMKTLNDAAFAQVRAVLNQIIALA